jgi:hypothetical protein
MRQVQGARRWRLARYKIVFSRHLSSFLVFLRASMTRKDEVCRAKTIRHRHLSSFAMRGARDRDAKREAPAALFSAEGEGRGPPPSNRRKCSHLSTFVNIGVNMSSTSMSQRVNNRHRSMEVSQFGRTRIRSLRERGALA